MILPLLIFDSPTSILTHKYTTTCICVASYTVKVGIIRGLLILVDFMVHHANPRKLKSNVIRHFSNLVPAVFRIHEPSFFQHILHKIGKPRIKLLSQYFLFVFLVIGDMSCDFEDSSICGYDIGDKFVWQEGFIHYLPSIDHTYGNESGMCMDFTDFMIVDFFSILI